MFPCMSLYFRFFIYLQRPNTCTYTCIIFKIPYPQLVRNVFDKALFIYYNF